MVECFNSFPQIPSYLLLFSHVSLAQHNKALNVRLTNPLPKDPEDESFDKMLKEDETWAIYVNFYMESEIRYIILKTNLLR